MLDELLVPMSSPGLTFQYKSILGTEKNKSNPQYENKEKETTVIMTTVAIIMIEQ